MRYIVQHHPSRPAVLERLLRSLPNGRVSVVTDPDPEGRPSAWRTYRLCLETSQDDAGHVLILQDDAVCQPGFSTAAVEAARARPDALISFFHYALPPSARMQTWKAIDAREPFWAITGNRYVPTVALLWPVKHIQPFLHWADTVKKVRPDYLADDPVIGDWASRHRVLVLQTAPSLVEHPDDVPSLTKRTTGKRTAIALVQHCDDWTRLLEREDAGPLASTSPSPSSTSRATTGECFGEPASAG